MNKHITLLTNRLQVTWAEPAVIAARYSVARLRFPKDNRWDTFCRTLEECPSFAQIEGCLFTKEQEKQWYYILFPTEAKPELQASVTRVGDACESVWYDQPTDLPDHPYLLLRLFLNALRQIGHAHTVYNLFGNPILFDSRNFSLGGVHPDYALIGVQITLTPELCLVAQTKTFTRVRSIPPKANPIRLYDLDPATYQLNRYMPNSPFDPERRLYTPQNPESDTHHVIAQLKLSNKRALNCKVRVQQLLLDALNHRFKGILSVQFTRVSETTCVRAPYTDKLIEVQRTSLQGLTLSVEDLVQTNDSQRLKDRLHYLVKEQKYHNKGDLSAHRSADYLHWIDVPEEARLVIQLVPQIALDTNNERYLSVYTDTTGRWKERQVQHLQVKKVFIAEEEPDEYIEIVNKESGEITRKIKKKEPKPDQIDPSVMLPRLVTELTIKHIIAGRMILSSALARQFDGWQIGIAQYCTEHRGVVGGYLDIVFGGYLSYYAIGELFRERAKRISEMGGLMIAYTDREIEEMFQMREIGGTGPFWHITLPNRKTFVLYDGMEHALPNLIEIDKRIGSRRQRPPYTYIVELLREAGLGDIPDYKEMFGIGDCCTQSQVRKIGEHLQKELKQPKLRKWLYEHVSNGQFNYLKRKESLEAAFGGLTDIHWWIDQGNLRYLAATNHRWPNLTSSWKINGLPHVRTLRCTSDPGYFETEEGRAMIPLFIDSLTCGFGRYDAATVRPMPFKLLEEWLDQVSLHTFGRHLSSLNTAFVNPDSVVEETPIIEQTF